MKDIKTETSTSSAIGHEDGAIDDSIIHREFAAKVSLNPLTVRQRRRYENIGVPSIDFVHQLYRHPLVPIHETFRDRSTWRGPYGTFKLPANRKCKPKVTQGEGKS